MKIIKYIAITIIAICVIGLLYGCESTYTRAATITKCEKGMVYAVDTSGNVWTYEGSGKAEQEITLIMYDNHTENIKDDIVKGVKTK